MTGFGPPQSLSGSSLEVADSPSMTFRDPRHRLSAATIFQQAKHPHSDCEDALVLNPSGWAGVVDGATAKSPTLFPLPRGGTGSSGLFAAQVVADALAACDAGLAPRELVTLVSDTLRDRIADVEVEPLEGAVPTCCFAVTNGDTIVAVGDCGYAFLSETGQVEEWRGDLAVDIHLRNLATRESGRDCAAISHPRGAPRRGRPRTGRHSTHSQTAELVGEPSRSSARSSGDQWHPGPRLFHPRGIGPKFRRQDSVHD